MTRKLLLIAAMTAFVASPPAASAAPGDLDLVAPPDADVWNGSISGDGRFVAYSGGNVVVRDMNGGTLEELGPGGDPSISTDGRFVAFVASDGQIRLRDRVTGETSLVSRASGPDGAPSDGFAAEPRISTDGRIVAFLSTANNLSDADAPGDVTELYVRDRASETTTLVSRLRHPVEATRDADSVWHPALSADGRFVAFDSGSDDLVADTVSPTSGVYVHDLSTGRTLLGSRGSDGAVPNAASYDPSLSDDGRYLAFDSDATNLGSDDNDVCNVFVRDLQTNETTLVTPEAGPAMSERPTISADGRRVAYSQAGDGDYYSVVVADRADGTFTRVTRNSAGEPANTRSLPVTLSGDGRFGLFGSDATNLDAAATTTDRHRLFRFELVAPQSVGTPQDDPSATGAPEDRDVAPPSGAAAPAPLAFAHSDAPSAATFALGPRISIRLQHRPLRLRVALDSAASLLIKLRRPRRQGSRVIRRRGRPGENVVALRLPPGSWAATIVATDVAGRRSRSVTVPFVIRARPSGRRSRRQP